MKNILFITINFHGGIISPGNLLNTLLICRSHGVLEVKFGLRQQLIIAVYSEEYTNLCHAISNAGISYEPEGERHPNIVSSFPAEEIFITKTWLSEGTYKDVLDLFHYVPRYKINISDSNQCFTPVITGNINWVAAAGQPHFWQLLIRLPKTNHIAEWDQMIYTNDLAKASECIEEIFDRARKLKTGQDTAVAEIFKTLTDSGLIARKIQHRIDLPLFNLPYYEGLNRYGDKYWLGIYRRDESFSVHFLIEVCRLCLETKTGQLCSTPWKSIIIKNINPAHRERWNRLLNIHQINVRHAANELNFQVEDNCESGLKIKQFLIHQLQKDDTRSFGLCIGIKTRKKSEVFCNILIRKKVWFSFAGIDVFPLYDILCSKDFNPNERTDTVFSSNNPKFVLFEQLRRAIASYYHHQENQIKITRQVQKTDAAPVKTTPSSKIFRCKHCLTIYTVAALLPAVSTDRPDANHVDDQFRCELCESPKSALELIPAPQRLVTAPA